MVSSESAGYTCRHCWNRNIVSRTQVLAAGLFSAGVLAAVGSDPKAIHLLLLFSRYLHVLVDRCRVCDHQIAHLSEQAWERCCVNGRYGDFGALVRHPLCSICKPGFSVDDAAVRSLAVWTLSKGLWTRDPQLKG